MIKNYINKCVLLLLLLSFKSITAQIIYQHSYGTSTFTAVNPYTVTPNTIDANLSASQWSTSFASGFSSLAGATGQALSLSNSGGTPTYSLTFNVASGFNCDITAFSFWRQRSAAGAQTWTLTVNGSTVMGAGTTPTAGVNTGTLSVSNPVNGLSGTVNVVLQLSGASSTGTFRLDDFTLYGSTYPVTGCTTPTLQASSFGSSSIGNNSAVVSWNPGSGGNVIVIARQGSPVSSVPAAGIAYTANSSFGLGQQIGAGNYVVYNGTGTFVNVTSLSPASNYYFSVFEYNTTSGSPCYLTPGLSGSLTTTGSASGLQIRSILVDACNGSGSGLGISEPYNEMVFFRSGSSSIPIAQISIAGKGNTGGFTANKWPNLAQDWHGLVQNSNTASKTALLNATIQGCGFIREPVGGIIPANSDVIMVCSQYLNTTYNSFTNLNDSIYIVYQDTVTSATAGHFSNWSATPGNRSLAIFDNANGFSDTVTYDISLLLNHSDGDAVDFTNSGVASYVNRGCQAPYIPLSVNAGNDKNVCFNSSVAFTATVSGTYNTVNWSGGAGSFSNVSALTTTYTPGVGEIGTVKLYCEISNNCPPHTTVAKDSVLITILQLPQANLSASNGYSLCPSANSVLSYSITNPAVASVVTPSWSSPSSSANTYTVSSPAIGTSVVYTLNLNNVCGTTTQTFEVFALESPSVTLSVNSLTACAGETLALSATSNAGNYAWSNPVSTNSAVVITANTTTTGVVTTTNSCGSAQDIYTLTVTPSVSLSVNNSNVSLCSGQSATVTANSSVGTYTWLPGGQNTNTFVVSSAGEYTVSSANECFSATETVSVSVSSVPTITITELNSSSLELCSNGSQTLVLSANGSVGSYTWSNGANTSTISVTTPGVYSATVSTPGCGTANTSVTVSSIANPTIALAANSFTACSGQTINLSANSSENNYSWSNSSNSTSTLSVLVNTLTTGVVTTTNACGSASDSFTINVVSSPTLSLDFTSLSLCLGQTATITATSDATDYSWLPGGITSNTISVPATAEVYTVYASNACFTVTATSSVTVSNGASLSIIPSSGLFCQGTTMTLSLTGSVGSYSWSTGATSPSIAVTNGGVYTASVTTSCGLASSSINLNSVPVPTVSVSPSSNILCPGYSATFTASSNMSNYQWSTGATSAVITPSLSGVYTVSVSNACGTATASAVTSTISFPPITLTASSLSICANETATLTVSGGVPLTTGSPVIYNWSNSSSTGSVVTTNGGTITVTNTNVCDTKTATVVVDVISVDAALSATPSSGVKPLVVDFTNNSTGANSYLWTFGNGNSASTQTVSSQSYTNAGVYTVYLLATNGTCTDLDSVLINVLNEEPGLIIPNVFTPNADSANDVFKVKAFNIVTFNCVIYDRWGIQMFEWNDVNKGWDGKTDGKEVPTGTYFYMITAKDINDKEIKKQGSVNLFR